MFTLFHSPLEKLNEELKELEEKLEKLLVFIEKRAVSLIKNSKGKEIIEFLKKEKKELESSHKNIEKIKAKNLPPDFISITERVTRIIEAIELVLKNSKTNPFYYLSNNFLENLKRIRSYLSGESGAIPTLLNIIEKVEQIITKQKEFRRNFLKLGAAHSILLALSQLGVKDEKERDALSNALMKRDYDTVRKILRKVSNIYGHKPKIELFLPNRLKELIKHRTPEDIKYLQENYLNPIRAVLAGERFSLHESNEAILPFESVVSEYLRINKAGEIPKKGKDGIAVNFVPEEAYVNIDRNIITRGFALFPNHGLMENGENLMLKSESKIPSKLKEEHKSVTVRTKDILEKNFSEEFSELIAYSEEIDIALSIFEVWDNSTIKNKRGVNFTPKVTDGEQVFMMRPKKAGNYAYGGLEKGEVLINSYYKKDFKSTDLILTTINTHHGDSGSPVFNVRGDVIGMVWGELNLTNIYGERLANFSMVVSSKYILYFLHEVEVFLSAKLGV